jgi:ABC-type bacteriocin/lantibiotic exporter with double-glycine peptidase domain
VSVILLTLLLTLSAPLHSIDGVPFVLQKSQYCGPASLSSVLAYYGEDIDQDRIGESVYHPRLEGSLITDLEDFAQQMGFQAKTGIGTVEEIRGFILGNRPVIVLVDLGFWVISKPHYLVVYGFNEEGFLAHNGFEKARWYRLEEFEKIWAKAGNSFLLIHR